MVGVVCSLSSDSAQEIFEIEKLSNSIAWSYDSIRAEFSNPCAQVLGIRYKGGIRGFLIAHVVAGEAHIVSFAVHPEWRRLGLGRSLIQGLLGRLKSDANQWVTLEVRASNKAAISLYHSLGFFESGIRTAYYRDNSEDAQLLRLNLDDWKQI